MRESKTKMTVCKGLFQNPFRDTGRVEKSPFLHIKYRLMSSQKTSKIFIYDLEIISNISKIERFNSMSIIFYQILFSGNIVKNKNEKKCCIDEINISKKA